MYEPCVYMKISITYRNEHVAESPYVINNMVYPDDCMCPIHNINEFIESWECGLLPSEITERLKIFGEINWDQYREKVIKKFDRPHSVSLCHYVIKNNEVYRKCYGKYVGYNMFMDNILLSLARKVKMPDLEFFVNLGDWPLSTDNLPEKYPILSWCASTDSYDIVMPTHDITESTLENMGRVMLDILSVQGNTEGPWESRIPKLFWRGRDSNRHRLDLIDISRKYPDLFNVSLTNFFFYRDEEHIYGPKSDYVSFFRFFDYKYQLAIDGTVAPYRTPYLLAGGSLVFKPESKYMEHFYKDLVPNFHFVPVKKDLSDLVDKLKWAIDNDDKAKEIAKNSRSFVNDNLLPKNIFCYHVHLFRELSKVITSSVKVFEDMEHIKQTKAQNCDCESAIKDEL
ncbi:KDEL motif-containing protein 1-like isoform X2 [Anoplophora glabripennis]|nr:KDEL motif-containing protein 1-like isoform X2 [Anoplophora glabripennis]